MIQPTHETDAHKAFEDELSDLLNRHSIENLCDMPDYLLASMIRKMIIAIGPSIKETLDWHGCFSMGTGREIAVQLESVKILVLGLWGSLPEKKDRELAKEIIDKINTVLSSRSEFSKEPSCPHCHRHNIIAGHHGGTWAVPECYYWECEDCHHQWGHG